MTQPFPEPTLPADSRAEVLVRYLDYFRSRLIERIEQLPEPELRRSRLPSGWTGRVEGDEGSGQPEPVSVSSRWPRMGGHESRWFFADSSSAKPL